MGFTHLVIKHLKGKILSRRSLWTNLYQFRGLLRSLRTTVLLAMYTHDTALYQLRVFVFWLFMVLYRAEDHLETKFKLEPIPCNGESYFIFFQPFFNTSAVHCVGKLLTNYDDVYMVIFKKSCCKIRHFQAQNPKTTCDKVEQQFKTKLV